MRQQGTLTRPGLAGEKAVASGIGHQLQRPVVFGGDLQGIGHKVIFRSLP
jgi:hypothetical protein